MRFFWILLLSMMLSIGLSGEELLFRSNEMGMPLERIQDYRRDEFTNVLSVDKEEDTEIRRLYTDGEITKKWEKVRSKGGIEEKYYEDGELSSINKYDNNGLLLEEISYLEGEVNERRAYVYVQGLLKEIILFNGNDQKVWSTRFLRSSAGRLRKMIREGEKDEGRVSLFRYSTGTLMEEWHGTRGTGNLFRLDASGNTLSEERWEENVLTEHTEFFKSEEGKRSITENMQEGFAVYRQYDDRDRVVLERTTQQGSLIEEIIQQYEGDDLTIKQRRTPGLKEKWTYEYNQDGDLEQEEYVKNGNLIKVTVYTGEDTYYEDLYRNEIPVIRVFYSEDRKTGEEFLDSYEH